MADTDSNPKHINWGMIFKIFGFVILGAIAFEVIRLIVSFFSGVTNFEKEIEKIVGSAIQYISRDFSDNCGTQPDCSVNKDETTCTNEPKCGWDQDQEIDEKCINKGGRQTGEKTGSGWKCFVTILKWFSIIFGGPIIIRLISNGTASKAVKEIAAQTDRAVRAIQDRISLKTSAEVVRAKDDKSVSDEALPEFTNAVANKVLYDETKKAIEDSTGTPTERAEQLSKLQMERSLVYDQILKEAKQKLDETKITERDLEKIKEFEIPKV